MTWTSETDKQIRFRDTALPHMDTLFNSAVKLTYNKDDADDLVQDTYYKAYKYFGHFKPGTSIKAWLYSILKNTFINNYRKKSKQPNMLDYSEVEPYIETLKESNGSIGSDYFDSKIGDLTDDFSDEVKFGLERLTNDFRLILVLADIEEFTYEEIAKILNIPLGTVRSRLFRARKSLHNILKPEKVVNKIKIDSKITNKIKTTTKILKSTKLKTKVHVTLSLNNSVEECLCTAC